MLLSRTRRALDRAVRTRVAGPDYAEIHERLWDAPGERWFSPGDPIWRVHGDPSMYIGGLRALLLQSLHPVAMQAVVDHSSYRADPWGRLQSISRFIGDTTMGTIPDAERAIATVRHVHDFVTGAMPDGTPYEANDPHLLAWVHVAEIDSFLTAHQAYGAHALTAAEQDTYVEQCALVATRLGVLDPPTTVSALRKRIIAFSPELARTPGAEAAADLLLRHPPLPVVARPAYRVLADAAVGLLPAWARARLRLTYRPLADGLLTRPLAAGAMRTLRWAFAAGP